MEHLADYAGFTYDGKGLLECRTCRCLPPAKPHPTAAAAPLGRFTYDARTGLDFPYSESLPKEFRNLKQRIKDHCTRNAKHQEALIILGKKDKEQKKSDAREVAVKMRMARKAYFHARNGLSGRLFEQSCLEAVLNGTDLGDTNQSQAFYNTFKESLADSIEDKLDEFLASELIQTGYAPVLNLIADKATWKKVSRQMIAALLIVPDAPQLITTTYLAILPMGTSSTGYRVAENLKKGVDQRGIKGEQIVGVSVDGQYIHDGVEDCFIGMYKKGDAVNISFNHDPMHRSALPDKHVLDAKVNKKGQFDWLAVTTSLGKDCYNYLSWGQKHALYQEVGITITGHIPQSLKTTHDVRYANSKVGMYTSVIDNLEPLIGTFEEIITRNKDGGSKQQEKADEAETLRNRILNGKTLLHFLGCCDIYTMYSQVICECQVVNILPWRRLAKIDAALLDFSNMVETADDHSKCVVSREHPKCRWHYLHTEGKKYVDSGIISNTPIPDETPIPRHNTRGAHKQNVIDISETEEEKEEQEDKEEDEEVEEEDEQEDEEVEEVTADPSKAARQLKLSSVVLDLKKVTAHFSSELKSGHYQIYHPTDRDIIKNIKSVTDLKTLIKEIKTTNYVRVSARKGPKFVKTLKDLAPQLKEYHDSELQPQFRVFCSRLDEIKLPEQLTPQQKEQSVSETYIQVMLETEKKMYVDCELIMYGICVASLKYGVESVVESLFSQFESKYGPRRNAKEETMSDEFEITVNGPELAKADNVLKSALELHFKDKRREGFLTQKNVFQNMRQSKPVKRLKKVPSKFPFM